MKHMRLGGPRNTPCGPPDLGIRMNVGAAVVPTAVPASAVQKHTMRAPIKAGSSRGPTPGREKTTDAHAVAEANRATDEKSPARRKIHDTGIIVGNHHVARIHGHDGNVRSAAHDHLAVALQ